MIENNKFTIIDLVKDLVTQTKSRQLKWTKMFNTNDVVVQKYDCEYKNHKIVMYENDETIAIELYNNDSFPYYRFDTKVYQHFTSTNLTIFNLLNTVHDLFSTVLEQTLFVHIEL